MEDIKVEDFGDYYDDEDATAQHVLSDSQEDSEVFVQDSNTSHHNDKKVPNHGDDMASQDKASCPFCPNKFCSVRSLKAHLAWVHYGKKILEASGSSQGNCGKCNFKLTSKHKVLGRDIVLHLMSKHGYLYKVVPDDLAARLLQMDSVGKGWREMHICNGTAPEGKVNCPYCSLPIKRYDVLVEHIVLQHHLDDILSSSGCINTDCCNICAKKFTSSKKKSVPQKLASHLAMVHGYLNMVLTTETRIELARLKEYLSHILSEKGLNLREQTKVKSLSSEKKPTVKKINNQPIRNKDQQKRSKRRGKDKTKSVGAATVPDNIKERLTAFLEAQGKGEFGEEPNSVDMINDDGTSKSFLTSTQLIEWECYLCFHKAKGLPQLKTHLASRHFREQVLFFWENDKSFEKPCQYCQKEVFEESLPLGRKQFFAIYHLVHEHDILYHIVNEHIKKGLDEFDKPIIVCPICQAGHISKAELELHVFLDHYREKIRTATNSTSAICGICNVKFHWRRTTLRHIAKQHREHIRKVIDLDVLEYLDKLNDCSPAVFIKEESDVNFDYDAQMNFVDVSSILVKSEETLTAEVKVEPSETFADASPVGATGGPSKAEHEVSVDDLSVETTAEPVIVGHETSHLEVDCSKKANMRKTLDNISDEDLADIVVTNDSSN